MNVVSPAKRSILVVLALQLPFGTLALRVAGAAPTIRQIQPRGLKAGGVTALVIEGAGLLPEPRLLMSGVAIANQTVKPGGKPERVEIEVTLDAAAPAGVYLARLAAAGGVSNGEAIAVSDLPEAPFGATIDSLPVALSGALSGSNVLSAKFPGRAGQRIVADAMARRLGAAIDPVIQIFNARGEQLAWSPALRAIDGDARAACVLAEDGEYRVDLHDALYRAGAPGHVRLCLGELSYADFVFPLGLEAGHRADFSLIGALPESKDRVGIGDRAIAGLAPAAWPADLKSLTGGRPPLAVSDFAELVETPEASATELTAAPVAVTGRLLKPGAEGLFRLPVKPGAALHIEVLADRLGLPVDAMLSVQADPGGQLGANDDRPGTKDPGLDVTPPAGVERLLIKVRDLYGAGGPDHLYRLIVTPAAQPEIRVTLSDDRLQAAPGSAGYARVKIERAHYAGAVRLVPEGLPAELAWDVAEIPAGANQALVSVSARGDGQAAPAAAIFSLRTETVGIDPPVARRVGTEQRPETRYQPWLASELAAASSAVAGPLSIAWAPWSEGATLLPGKMPLDAQVQRAAGVTGPVRLSLVTSQTMPTKQVKENNQEKTVDDVEHALRLATETLIPADQTAAHGEIAVPGNLPIGPYDFVLQADLLAADNKTVVASAFSPVRRAAAVSPLKLELTGPAEASGVAGIGPAGKLTGKLIRAAGFQAPVKIHLVGLPKETPSPSVTLALDAGGAATTDFELPATFPYGTKPGPLAGVKLVASSAPDPKAPEVESRSNEIPVTITVVAGEKPPADRPLTIFEDQAEFVAALVQGQGQISLFGDEKFSGAASCKVTPDQRFNPSLPGLNVKIRQNPAAGEYRYLQFAWKKQGGQSICLQLNHDGAWGPVAPAPGKFRYHAGPGPECYGASLAVDNKLPAGFTLVTRDLFADFGEFTLMGLALSPVDGDYALFDHIYLGKTPGDFELVKP